MNKKSILVISNNPFSKTDNNGKTLASLFIDFNDYKISQLYFNANEPTDLTNSNFFNITDSEMLNKFFKKNNTSVDNNSIKTISKGHKSPFKRLLREVVWSKKRWNDKMLNDWLEEVNPDLIFFMAGDSEFAFNITNYIKEQYNSKLVVYITDDYYVKHGFPLTFNNYRKKRLNSKLKETLIQTDLFVTISNEMSTAYERMFGKKSLNFINTPIIEKKQFKDNGHFIYAGSLGLGRVNTIIELAETIDLYNETNNENIRFDIFTASHINNKELLEINKIKSLVINEPISQEELYDIYNNYSYLVHVESFHKRNVIKTKYSISTKIPEYLLLDGNIIGIGPKGLASLNFIKKSGVVINKKKNFLTEIESFLLNRTEYKSKSLSVKEINQNKKTLIVEIIRLLN